MAAISVNKGVAVVRRSVIVRTVMEEDETVWKHPYPYRSIKFLRKMTAKPWYPIVSVRELQEWTRQQKCFLISFSFYVIILFLCSGLRISSAGSGKEDCIFNQSSQILMLPSPGASGSPQPHSFTGDAPVPKEILCRIPPSLSLKAVKPPEAMFSISVPSPAIQRSTFYPTTFWGGSIRALSGGKVDGGQKFGNGNGGVGNGWGNGNGGVGNGWGDGTVIRYKANGSANQQGIYSNMPQDRVLNKVPYQGNVKGVKINFIVDAYAIPDEFEILYCGNVVFHTGLVSGKATFCITLDGMGNLISIQPEALFKKNGTQSAGLSLESDMRGQLSQVNDPVAFAFVPLRRDKRHGVFSGAGPSPGRSPSDKLAGSTPSVGQREQELFNADMPDNDNASKQLLIRVRTNDRRTAWEWSAEIEYYIE